MRFFIFLIISVLSSDLSSQVKDNLTPKEFLLQIDEAVKNNDVDLFESYLIVDDTMTSEYARQYAELFILVKQVFVDNAEKLDSNFTKSNFKVSTIKKYLLPISFISAINYKNIAASGVFSKRETYWYVNHKLSEDLLLNNITLMLTMSSGQWKHRVVDFKKPEQTYILLDFMQRLKYTFIESKDDVELLKRKKEFDLYYAQPTRLRYVAGILSGRVNSEKWEFVAGYGNINQDNSIQIKLFSNHPETRCGGVLGSSQIIMVLPGEGEYDFNLIENTPTFFIPSADNLNLFATDGKCKIEVLKDKKVIKGMLVISYNANNFVNGNFEVPLCD